MKKNKINLLHHYRKLYFFLFNRYNGENYKIMRGYFAHILISEIEKYTTLNKKKIIDIGGADGSFCKILSELRKCDSTNLDPFPGKRPWKNTIISFADKIPFGDNLFDITICRNVFEHIPFEKQQSSINEMYRVTKHGGYGYIVIPPWYNPHAGHSLKPFHILPFRIAKFIRELIFRSKITGHSYEDLGLYKITFKKMKQMIKISNFQLIDTLDTHFRLHFLTKIPVLQEILIPAVSFIMLKE
jgi:SAM-dependent methyltransferase